MSVVVGGVNIQPLFDNGLIVNATIQQPVSVRFEVIKTSNNYPMGWELIEIDNGSTVIASGDNSIFTMGSHTVNVSGSAQGYTGGYSIRMFGQYGWYQSWEANFYTTDANGIETFRLNTEGPKWTTTEIIETLDVSSVVLTSPLTKATLSSMATTSPGFSLQQIIQTRLVSSSDITTLFTTVQDYQLLVTPSYGSNSIVDLLTLGFGGYTFLDSVLSAGAIYTHVGQVGLSIDGEAADDQSGWSVSLSGDGSVVAIGAPYNDGNGTDAGHVRVYQNVGGTWAQVGADIDGEAVGDHSGYSVSLSSDGSVVAIMSRMNDGGGSNAGHVRVYQNVAGTWTQVGADIDGEAAGDEGYSVSLSSDGSVLAVGAWKNDGNGADAGHTRVFQNVAGTWTQVGADIDGEAAGDSSGFSVSLSSDGSILAIGAIFNDGNGADAGHTRVFQNVSGTWTQIGTDIDGEAAGDVSGYAVSLSSDGSILAIGAKTNDGSAGNAGHVRVFQNVAGAWTQVGADLDGEAANDQSGIAVSLSSDGSVVAIGAKMNDGGGSNAGHARLYKNVAGTWIQVGPDFDGSYDTRFGQSVSLSSDGTIFATGAVFAQPTGYRSGQTRIYSIKDVSSTSELIPAGFDFSTAVNVFNFSTNELFTLFYPTISLPITSADLTTLTQTEPSISGLITYNLLQTSDVKTLLPGTDGFNALLNGSYGGGGNESYTLKQIVDNQYLTKTDIRNLYPGSSGIQQLANDYSFNLMDLIYLEYIHMDLVQAGFRFWTQVGADIDSEAAADYSGRSVSLSSDGSVVAIGAHGNSGNGSYAGHVRIYQNTGLNGDWTQVGADIDGEAQYDYLGQSVSLSSDGSVVAIGAHGNDGNGTSAGHVRVYQNTGLNGDWTQVGADIDGEAAGDNSGQSVSLSSDGSVVAIGAPGNDGNGSYAGHVRVYQNVGGTWVQAYQDIDGEAGGDRSGWSVSLSSDGTVFAIGAHYNTGTGNSAGHVRIYNLPEDHTVAVTDSATSVKGNSVFTSKLTSVGITSPGPITTASAASSDPNVDYRATITLPGATLDSITDKPGLIAVVTTLYAAAHGVAENRLLVTLSAGSVVINIDLLTDGYYTPTCFPAGTPIQTDQGVTAIEQLVPGEHTLHGKSIIAITQTRPLQKHIVCFEKDSLGKNVPSQQTLCSKEHKVLYRGEMIKARNLADMCKNVKKVSYNGETLYNVLLEKHGKMLVNNMICETLHPENIAAKFAKAKSGPSKRAIA